MRRYAKNARCISGSGFRKGVGCPVRGKIWCFLSLNVDSHIKLMFSAIWRYLCLSVQVKLVQHTYSCLFGTFLCNNAKERGEKHTQERTCSVWSLLRAANKAFKNLLYSSQSESVRIRGESRRGSRCNILKNMYLKKHPGLQPWDILMSSWKQCRDQRCQKSELSSSCPCLPLNTPQSDSSGLALNLLIFEEC